MELLDQLPKIGINLTAAQGATVIAVLGALRFLKPRQWFDSTPRNKVFAVFGVAAGITVIIELLSPGFAVKEVVALSLISGVIAIGVHGTQKNVRKGSDNPRRP